MSARHAPNKPVPAEAATAADPELWLAHADLSAWADAHPCECEALCECEGEA